MGVRAAAASAMCFCVLAALAEATPAAETPAPVRLFDAGELTLVSYTVVKRLWVDTWRSAFWISTHDNAGAAIAALTAEAASLGASGVTNLYCIEDTGGWGGGYFCYGLAIKLR